MLAVRRSDTSEPFHRALNSIIDPNGEIQRVKAEKFFSKIEKLGKIQNDGVATLKYRLIDLESGKIGMRCISTGPSPLDLGIGAMA